MKEHVSWLLVHVLLLSLFYFSILLFFILLLFCGLTLVWLDGRGSISVDFSGIGFIVCGAEPVLRPASSKGLFIPVIRLDNDAM